PITQQAKNQQHRCGKLYVEDPALPSLAQNKLAAARFFRGVALGKIGSDTRLIHFMTNLRRPRLFRTACFGASKNLVRLRLNPELKKENTDAISAYQACRC